MAEGLISLMSQSVFKTWIENIFLKSHPYMSFC